MQRTNLGKEPLFATIFKGIIFVGCIGIILYGAFRLISHARITQSGTHVTGTIHLEEDIDTSLPYPNYTPIVSFTTLEGQTIRYVGSATPFITQYKEGQSVDVYYDPSDTNQIFVSGDIESAYVVAAMLFAAIYLIYQITRWFRARQAAAVSSNSPIS